jgi:hypothetical protein
MTFAILLGLPSQSIYGPISFRNWIVLVKKYGYPVTIVSPTHGEVKLCLLDKVSVTVSSEPGRRNFRFTIALAALLTHVFFGSTSDDRTGRR